MWLEADQAAAEEGQEELMDWSTVPWGAVATVLVALVTGGLGAWGAYLIFRTKIEGLVSALDERLRRLEQKAETFLTSTSFKEVIDDLRDDVRAATGTMSPTFSTPGVPQLS